jgi:diaminohydroxyphosphoribosylaminopyrimidine deaminase/5-amino-6-(5-phosphoribosylamino)uracil reductase
MSGEQYMRRALALAAQGLGRSAPNPAVGAVVVKDGRIISEGSHRQAGSSHAERQALLAAGEQARGAELYCTLEPCCHQGRTPPCTEIIISSGITAVTYAWSDPDPRCAGQGAARLRAAGIMVREGLLADQAAAIYEAYSKHKRTGLPWVTLKLAMTLDGKVATQQGDSRWITGEAARELVHQWRDEAEAVMVGVGTLMADNPQLTVRLPRADTHEPWRVIVDSQARTRPEAAVITTATPARCLIAVTDAAPAERVTALQAAGAEVIILPSAAGRVDLAALLQRLGERDMMGVLCEGGPGLAAGLVASGLVDKYQFFYAPRLAGTEGLSALGPLKLHQMSAAYQLKFTETRRIGDDLLVTATPCLRD